MSQQLKEKLIFIAAITGAILLIIVAGITGYIAITDPSSRSGIGTALVSAPFTIMIFWYLYKVVKNEMKD